MHPNDLGETLVLRSRPWRKLLLLAASLCFVAIGVFIMPAGQWQSLLTIGFFGLGAAVFAAQLLPGGSYLKLDRDGFTYAALFRTTHVPWHDVSPFAAGYVGPNKTVQFEVSHQLIASGGTRTASVFARMLTGASGALPETYGMNPDALAELMNRWRERALTGRS